MSILICGSTGRIGSQILNKLQGKVDVRAMTRSPDNASFPAGVTPVRGDLSDVDSFRVALTGVSTLFLLVPNVPDELTQAMLGLSIAREARVTGIVYLSVFKGESYSDVPHFAGKFTVERMVKDLDLPVTVLRPAYFIQNDLGQKSSLLNMGVYSSPVGSKGVSMVDVGDIADAAAIELLRRHRAAKPLGRETYDLTGPDSLTGADLAAIWTEALGRPIRYGGDDLQPMEQRLKTMLPGWHAMDLRLMFSRYQTDGASATADGLTRLAALLGRAPCSYRDFAKKAAAQWMKS